MVALSWKQWQNLIEKHGHLPGDKLCFRNDVTGRVKMLVVGDDAPVSNYPVLDVSTKSTPTWSAKTGYSQYNLTSPYIRMAYPLVGGNAKKYEKNLGSVNFLLEPKYTSHSMSEVTGGNAEREWRIVYAPTSYGQNWLDWLQATALDPSNARPYFRGYQDFNPVYLESLYKSRKFYVPKSATV